MDLSSYSKYSSSAGHTVSSHISSNSTSAEEISALLTQASKSAPDSTERKILKKAIQDLYRDKFFESASNLDKIECFVTSPAAREILSAIENEQREGFNQRLKTFGLEKFQNHEEAALYFARIQEKNLGLKPLGQRIPRDFHQIWLTHPDSPREMREQDIANVLHTHEVLEASGQQYTHNIWVYKRELTPKSLSILENHGLIVREISEMNEEFRLPHLFYKALVSKYWGIASNLLRYEIIRAKGGIYADLNYYLNQDLEYQILRYNFVLIATAFFMAEPEHPMLNAALNEIAERHDNPSLRLKDALKRGDISEITRGLTSVLGTGYLEQGNKDGRHDLLWPEHRPGVEFNSTHCYLLKDEMTNFHMGPRTHVLEDGICVAALRGLYEVSSLQSELHGLQRLYGSCIKDDLIIGQDSWRDGETWKPEDKPEFVNDPPQVSGLVNLANNSSTEL